MLVTGGTSGIGLGIAAAFAGAASNVVATGATTKEIGGGQSRGQGGRGLCLLDVRDRPAVDELVGSFDAIMSVSEISNTGPARHRHGVTSHPSPQIIWLSDTLPDFERTLARGEALDRVIVCAVWHLHAKERARAMPNLANFSRGTVS